MAFTVKKFANHQTLATFLATLNSSTDTIDSIFWDHGIVLVYH
jgi:hypothetical protein